MTPTGWYPDPSGLWESRWWDGTSWTDTVATGGFQSSEPVTSSPAVPTDESVPLAEVGGTYEREPAALRLTWSFLAFIPTRRAHETRWLPLPFVHPIIVEGVSAPGGPGRLRVSVRGPGYVGPGVYVVNGVVDASRFRALVLRQRAIVAGIHAATP
ncbi:MAG: DUF2510 domain-containing protein [Actinobacteria bacterium]|nr:DUF2510 domain-containing protein [Actinomycetota bacterium]